MICRLLAFFSGNREMPQSVPKQKKKAQQYKGQKKSESLKIYLSPLLVSNLSFSCSFRPVATLVVESLLLSDWSHVSGTFSTDPLCHIVGCCVKMKVVSLPPRVGMQPAHLDKVVSEILCQCLSHFRCFRLEGLLLHLHSLQKQMLTLN